MDHMSNQGAVFSQGAEEVVTTFDAPHATVMFDAPTLVFTVSGPGCENPNSVQVIEVLKRLKGETGDDARARNFSLVRVEIFANEAAVVEAFSSGQADPDRSVCVFDSSNLQRYFTFTAIDRTGGHKMPRWASGAHWGVIVRGRAENAACQIRAHFATNFGSQLGRRQFPWGRMPKGERATLSRVDIDRARVTEIVARLNSGPDEATGLVNSEHGRRLPPGQRFSYFRVPQRAAVFPSVTLFAALQAIEGFEIACARLARADEDVRRQILTGVEIDPSVVDAYLDPRYGDVQIDRWFVRRPDLHVDGLTLAASENDEMPGGFIDAYHLDYAYGLNAEAWNDCFARLTAEGPVLFVISSDWSRGYQRGVAWFCEHVRSLGWDMSYVMSDDLASEVSVRSDGVYRAGSRVGTIWRLFPIFETRGLLADLVLASRKGVVRMVPEFAHFGSKTWYTIFGSHKDFFREHMRAEDLTTLHTVLPESAMVYWEEGSVRGFPIRLGDGTLISSWDQLLELGVRGREALVLKITGATSQTARGHGVFVGHANTPVEWKDWLKACAQQRTPFLVQKKFGTSEHRVPVLNTATGGFELFAAKVLVRPWVVGGKLVSAPATCTPHTTTKVHGMVDMAMVPVVLV